ncbi:MAG: transglycosylase SLT domain-containing protein, partial [Candidatus Gastranaerophilales bacterium]|nr:transglycosylase SLT domain-containing protein [Candidatus Gastranaerophilales bacterium]
AKENVETTKTTELEKANEVVTTKQTELNDIVKKLDEAKAKEIEKENSVSSSSSTLPDEIVKKLDAKLGAGFSDKLQEVADNLGCDPADLVGLMNSESGLRTDAVNPHGGATGLIQFMPSTAKALGTTTSAIAQMSGVEQLDLVQKYFEMNGVSKYKNSQGKVTGGTLYTLTFLPAFAGKEVLCQRGDIYYNANSGLDANGDGKITQSELSDRVRNKYNEFAG